VFYRQSPGTARVLRSTQYPPALSRKENN